MYYKGISQRFTINYYCKKGNGMGEKSFFAKVRDIFCYCGLSKDEYRLIKREAYGSNYDVWKYLHPLFFVGYLFILAVSVFNGGATGEGALFIEIIMTAYLAAASLLFLFVLKKNSVITQLAIYFTMILMLGAAIAINAIEPNEIVISFVVLLVLLPMVMIDKPYFMAILLIIAVVGYLFAIPHDPGDGKFAFHAVNAISYGMFGIIINTFYNYIRIHELLLRKREGSYIAQQKGSAEETNRLNMALRSMSESAIELLGDIVESRDTDSGEHVRRVRGFTKILAEQVKADFPEYGLDTYTVSLITLASALHDVGKIAIPDSVLCKPAELTEDEFELMKTHCEKGCDIVGKMKGKWSRDYLETGMDICRYHHERWDGGGYPYGLKEDEIPIAAQIVGIADVYDALTSKRVYKNAYSYEEAYRMIVNDECGVFSKKLLGALKKCKASFESYAEHQLDLNLNDQEFEIVSTTHPDESFVIGLHDQDKTLREKLRLDEELSVLESLTEKFYYICYVNIPQNALIRFKADEQFAKILDSYGDELRSNEKFDKLLNSVIVAEDYDGFRKATERMTSMKILEETGYLSTNFRIRLESGIHYCKLTITRDAKNPDAVIIGISRRDEAHKKEEEYLKLQNELMLARQEMVNREKLAERLAVIDCVSSEYDYVCSLNADTMEVVVYRAEAWIRDMFKNLEDIVVSPEVRNSTLKGIIYPDDFEAFQNASRHEAVLKALGESGSYRVNYRAYKYGQLVNYQTQYTLDKNDPKRIVIGLRSIDSVNG